MNKRVLVLIKSMNLGGAETVAVSIANLLPGYGFEAGVAAAPGPMRSRLSPEVGFFELPRYSLLAIPLLLYRLHSIISKFRPQVIHAHVATLCLLAKLVCLFRKNRPLIVLTHHSEKTESVPDCLSGILFNFMADKLVFIARYKFDKLLHRGVGAGKMFYVPNFICMERYAVRNEASRRQGRQALGFGPEDGILLYAGRLVAIKRLELFLGVIRHMRGSGRNIKGLIVGEGPESGRLRALARDLRIEDAVRFTGFSEDVKAYYYMADLLVFPSSTEVLPMVLVEACAAGLPIVCSDIRGNDEVVTDGENGFLVRGDEKAYAEKIAALLDDPARYGEFSRNAVRIAAERFGEKKCMDKIAELYGQHYER